MDKNLVVFDREIDVVQKCNLVVSKNCVNIMTEQEYQVF